MKDYTYYAIHRVGNNFYFCMSKDKEAVKRGDQEVVVTECNLEPTEDFFKWEDDWTRRVNETENAVDLTQWT